MADIIPSKEEWLSALEKEHRKELQQRFLSVTVAICGLGRILTRGASASDPLTGFLRD